MVRAWDRVQHAYRAQGALCVMRGHVGRAQVVPARRPAGARPAGFNQ